MWFDTEYQRGDHSRVNSANALVEVYILKFHSGLKNVVSFHHARMFITADTWLKCKVLFHEVFTMVLFECNHYAHLAYIAKMFYIIIYVIKLIRSHTLMSDMRWKMWHPHLASFSDSTHNLRAASSLLLAAEVGKGLQ